MKLIIEYGRRPGEDDSPFVGEVLYATLSLHHYTREGAEAVAFRYDDQLFVVSPLTSWQYFPEHDTAAVTVADHRDIRYTENGRDWKEGVLL